GGVSLRAGGAKHGVEKAVHEPGLRAPTNCQHVRCFRQHQQGSTGDRHKGGVGIRRREHGMARVRVPIQAWSPEQEPPVGVTVPPPARLVPLDSGAGPPALQRLVPSTPAQACRQRPRGDTVAST
ncbi:unnamed protein product, partial [Ectocarpus sp. 13 AM-2016]